MKRYINYTLLSVVVTGIAFSSCDLDAPTQSSLDESTTFSTYALAEAELMSVNVSFGETNSYRGRFLPYYGLNNDVEVGSGTPPSKSNATNEKQSLWNFDTPANNSLMNTDNNAYSKFYEGIERANLAIAGIRKYGNIDKNPDMAQLLGEALTLRAVIYTDLTKAWGDVPARFSPNNNDNIYLPRTNRDSIYKVLLSDLKEAERYCYWPNQNAITKTTERVSKSFVKALRARIALYAGGYGLRGDGYRLSKDPELAPEKMYEIARKECEDVINSGKNELGSFKENFTKLCQDNVTAGGESLWEIPFSAGRGRVLYYEWGKDLDSKGKASVQLRSINKWCFGKLRYEWMNRIVTSTNDDGVNWQYMRLADVYLMAAEAENALGNTAKAWTYMEPVLARVLPSAKVMALKTKYTASKNEFFEGIVEQRALEFAGESLRKADLVRWGIIDSKMAEEVEKLNALSNRTGRYAGLPDKVYINATTDANNIQVYGLNKGEDNNTKIQELKNAGWTSKNWFVDNKTGLNLLTEDYIQGLYVVKPSTHCLWPIWQTFINNSNGMLNNNGIYGQLSD